MSTSNDKTVRHVPARLRNEAEKRLQTRADSRHAPQNRIETLRLVHELEVHQIELEIQNEELRQTRDAAEKALNRYTELYDFAPVGYITLDSGMVIREANLSGASLLGIERALLIGQRFQTFITAECRPGFRTFLGTALHSRLKQTCEVTLRNAGNAPLIVQIEAEASVVLQECRLALIDITGRRQAETALQESEERMYRLAEMAADAIIMLDDSGTVTFCNAASKRMFGCPENGILNCDFHQDFIPEHLRTAARQGLAGYGKPGRGQLAGCTTEVTALKKDGTEFPLELSVSAVKLHDTWHSIAIMRDISERKQLEERIREVIRQQQAILDNIPDMAWLKDREGRYVAVNEPFARSLGRIPRELVGKTDADIYPPELVAKYEQDFNEVMTSGRRAYFEDSIICPEGVMRHVEKIKTPIFNDTGAVIGVIGIAHDITDRKEVEVRLRHESTHDSLTGLYNRAFFDEELDRLSHGRMFPMSIVMADVNNLKAVNDAQGHQAGDRLICLAARIILKAFRAEDIVARIGGDEFAVLLPETGTDVAEEAVCRIMESHEIRSGQLSIAFGVASAENRDQLVEALTQSDARMYQNKSLQKAP